MHCIKALLLATLQFATTFFPSKFQQHTRFEELEESIAGSFEDVLATIPSSIIHDTLHERLPQLFKDGMFERDSSAVEAVHRTNPPLATKLLAAARYELLRRQNGNLTTTATTTAATVPFTTSSAAAVIVPVTLTSTDASGSVVTSIASALSSATVSVNTVLATTNSLGQTTLITTNVPAAVVTNQNGQVQTTALPTLNSNGALVETTTNAEGSTYVTTITPTGGVYSSVVLQTTTLPNGMRSTQTSFVVVSAPTAGSSTNEPHLQGAAAHMKPSSITISGLFVLAVAFSALLF